MVGIITFNRLNYLRECITSINPELHAHTNYELVIADDLSSDGTRDWLKAYFSKDEIIYGNKRGGVAINSNRILRAARDKNIDILFLLNDDILVKSGVFDIYINAIKKTEYDYFIYTDLHSAFTVVEKFYSNGIQLNRRITGDGSFLVMTKKVIEVVGGFEASFGLFGCEHFSHARRAIAAGFAPGAIDVVSAQTMVKSRQYYEIVNRSINNAEQYQVLANKKWIEIASEAPVVWNPIEI